MTGERKRADIYQGFAQMCLGGEIGAVFEGANVGDFCRKSLISTGLFGPYAEGPPS